MFFTCSAIDNRLIGRVRECQTSRFNFYTLVASQYLITHFFVLDIQRYSRAYVSTLSMTFIWSLHPSPFRLRNSRLQINCNGWKSVFEKFKFLLRISVVANYSREHLICELSLSITLEGCSNVYIVFLWGAGGEVGAGLNIDLKIYDFKMVR